MLTETQTKKLNQLYEDLIINFVNNTASKLIFALKNNKKLDVPESRQVLRKSDLYLIATKNLIVVVTQLSDDRFNFEISFYNDIYWSIKNEYSYDIKTEVSSVDQTQIVYPIDPPLSRSEMVELLLETNMYLASTSAFGDEVVKFCGIVGDLKELQSNILSVALNISGSI